MEMRQSDQRGAVECFCCRVSQNCCGLGQDWECSFFRSLAAVCRTQKRWGLYGLRWWEREGRHEMLTFSSFWPFLCLFSRCSFVSLLSFPLLFLLLFPNVWLSFSFSCWSFTSLLLLFSLRNGASFTFICCWGMFDTILFSLLDF